MNRRISILAIFIAIVSMAISSVPHHHHHDTYGEDIVCFDDCHTHDGHCCENDTHEDRRCDEDLNCSLHQSYVGSNNKAIIAASTIDLFIAYDNALDLTPILISLSETEIAYNPLIHDIFLCVKSLRAPPVGC